MKLIFGFLIVFLSSACGDTDDVETSTENAENSGKSWSVSPDGKADSYGEVKNYCADEGPQGCDNIGAECCGDSGLTCQEYTVYDYPRCLPPKREKTWTTVQPKTRGDVMDCVSSLTGDGKSLDVTISTPDYDAGTDGIVFLSIVEHPGLTGQEDRLVENSIANTVWGNSVYTWDFIAQSYYYDVKLFRVQGYKGVYTGRVNSNIADESWEISCWEPTIEVTARYDELSGGCLDQSGELATNPELGPEFIRGSGFGECMKITSALDEGFYGYQTFESPLLAGSDLTEAEMHFAHIADADLRGADLDGFDFGYATVTGSINAQTKFSEERCEATDSTTLNCRF